MDTFWCICEALHPGLLLRSWGLYVSNQSLQHYQTTPFLLTLSLLSERPDS